VEDFFPFPWPGSKGGPPVQVADEVEKYFCSRIPLLKKQEMLRKLKLKEADSYDVWVAAREMSSMVTKYLDGQAHAKSIGSEQGLAGWDDLVIECNDGTNTYTQVKRQLADFSVHAADRTLSVKKQGPDKGAQHPIHSS
jgi:hypothetical protein